MTKKLVPKLVVVILTLVIVAGIVGVVWYIIKIGLGEDLFVNCISELLGVIMSVLLFNRLIKWQENRRWLPAKCLLYARLLDIVDALLLSILPQETREVIPAIYQHGDIIAVAQIDLKNLVPRELPALSLLVERDFLRNALFEDKSAPETKQQIDAIGASLAQSRQKIDAILDNSAFLLEQEPIMLLMRQKHSSEELDLTLTRIDEAEQWTEALQKDIVISLSHVILTTIELRTWLMSKIKRHFVEIRSEQ